MHIFFTVIFALLLCGCRRTGDFGTAFVQQVSHYGGVTKTTNAIPQLHGTWSIQSDAEGFEVHLSGVSFADVQSFMQQVYGDPIDITTNLDGQPHGLYKAGVAIQFFGETNGIGFICLRAQ